ncbi:MAG: O-antigen ligase family protein [Pseudomonadota bacterium]
MTHAAKPIAAEQLPVINRVSQGASGTLIALGILASAVLWGGNRPMVAAILSLLVLTALSVKVFADKRRAIHRAQDSRLQFPALLFGAVLCWAAIQALPLPAPLAESIGHPAWNELKDQIGHSDVRISAEPGATSRAIGWLAACCAIFWLALRAGTRAGVADRMLLIIAAGSGLIAAYGILAVVLGTNPVTGPPAYPGVVTGTFVNRNAFAFFMTLGALACLPCFSAPHQSGHLPRGPGRTTAAGALLAITCAALFLSGSRAGVAAFLAALSVYLLLTRPHISSGLFRVSAAGAAAVVILSAPVLIERLADLDPSTNQRVDVYGLILSGIEARPLVGHGLGTFHDSFRPYLAASVSGAEWDYAHSTLLELIFELGIPGTLLVILGLAVIGWRCAAFAVHSRHKVAALGPSALAAAALHGSVDFAPQMPANTALFAMLLGLSCAATMGNARKPD